MKDFSEMPMRASGGQGKAEPVSLSRGRELGGAASWGFVLIACTRHKTGNTWKLGEMLTSIV